ncbi:MAG: Hsp20/alpha crystallin family protein [Limisphaerales bacterium]
MNAAAEAKTGKQQNQGQSQQQQRQSPQASVQRQPDLQQQSVDERFTTPATNISATDNDYVLELEMPGVDKSGLEVVADGNELVITGKRAKDIPEGELSYCESALANYRRTFELGSDVDTSKIEAQLTQGVLKLKLPKSEKAKSRKIPVQG